MSVATIKRLIMSSTVVSSFKRSKFKIIDEDGDLTESASVFGIALIIIIIGVVGGIEMGVFG